MSKPFALFLTIIVLTATGAIAMQGLHSTAKTQENVLKSVEQKAERLLN